MCRTIIPAKAGTQENQQPGADVRRGDNLLRAALIYHVDWRANKRPQNNR